MPDLLITNDDGVSSPAVAPLARALGDLGIVAIVVPDRERSWIAKAITRHDELEVQLLERDGLTIHTTTGYPADCVQLGIHSLYDEPPGLVVSGINIGFNHGSAYTLSSGTVGGAIEAWIAGVPAVAVSAGTNGHWPSWQRWAKTEASAGMWERLAAVTRDIIGTLLERGFSESADIICVNLPEEADLDTPRRVVGIARVGYDRLFGPTGPGRFAHEYGGRFIHFDGLTGTDIEVTRRGEVAITPIRLPRTAQVPDSLRAALER